MTWRDDATCRSAPVDLFFPEVPPGPLSAGWRALAVYVSQVAADYCAGCTVRLDCLAHACTLPERDGIWAGSTPPERQRAESILQLHHQLTQREAQEALTA